MAKRNIVFIHGLWLHASSWEPWAEFFRARGYDSVHPGWPGEPATVSAAIANSAAVANRGIDDMVASYAQALSKMSEPPILIGHSFGGLFVEKLLGQGLGAAGIAIDPAPIKGVWQLPISALRATFPALANPFNLTKSVALTFDQFRYGFANAVSEEEARMLYGLYAISSPARPLFQVAAATFNPHAANAVAVSNAQRGPLLLTSGERDNTVPPVLVRAAFEKYAASSAVTEFKSFADRGHSLVIDSGWKEIAEYAAEWLAGKGL